MGRGRADGLEHAPPGKRGAYGSFSQIGVPAGLILAQLMFIAVSAWTTPEQFTAWGWRLPFLFSIVLVAVGLVVRLSLAESPVFSRLLREQARSRRPIVELFRERRREVVLAALSFVANTTIGYIFLAYLLAYGTAVLKLSRDLMLTVVVIGSLVWLMFIVVGARWSDRVGRRPVYLVGSVLLVVWAFPFFLLVDTAVPALIVLSVVVLTIGLGLTYGPQAAFFAELFEPRYRYSGASFAYAVGAVVGGGFAPLIATALQTATGESWPVSAYMFAVGLVSLGAVLLLRETRGQLATAGSTRTTS
jgi:MFS family permease